MRALKRVIAITLLSTLPMVTSHAALGWFTCEVHATGMAGPGATFIQLTDLAANPAFSTKWFVGTTEIANQVLATALAAATSDMTVLLYADPDTGGFPVALRLYLKK